MKTLHYYQAHSQQGQRLLDDYVVNICARLGLRLEVRNDSRITHRGYVLLSHIQADIVLFDLSMEQGHCYGSLTETVKHSSKVILVSRTPLPRNVFVRGRMCAPIHGHTFGNEELGRWLEEVLFTLVQRNSTEISLPHDLYQPKWATLRPGDVFLSFRGTQEASAAKWVMQHQASTGKQVRMVAEGEYAYPTECMTAQQLWEGVAKLGYETNRTREVVIWYSDDYFDSFWTSSEFLWLMRFRLNGNMIRDARFIHGNGISNVTIGHNGINVPSLNAQELEWVKMVLNNSDPFTAAPETQIPARGGAKLIQAILGPLMGYYREEFTGPDWWNVIRVPCPYCRPLKRPANQVKWIHHIQNHLIPFGAVDYFGYFSVEEAQLRTGHVKCPQCQYTMKVVNKRPSRFLWMPIQTTERDQEREMFVENRVWEVV